MRFLHGDDFLSAQCVWGCCFVQQVSNELGKRGHQVDVVYCKDAFGLLLDEHRQALSRTIRMSLFMR